MSQNLNNNEEILRTKLEMEEKIVESIDSTITDIFKNRPQDEIDFHKETAYRVYQLDAENEELRHQLYYSSSVTDALSNLLIELGIITKEKLASTLEEIHKKAMEDFQKSQEFIQNEMQKQQSTDSSVAEI